jgi:hypothetical protein
VTKKILKACNSKKRGEELQKELCRLLNSFPMSSTKLVYEQDRSKVPADVWDVLIDLCVQTDKNKMERCNRAYVPMGLKPITEYGRYSPKSK